ncbi:hypothetical protein AGMMS49944_30650 [Spirochaetia bacterium]|nr:hypothetical protein AGMMS49944_30650 [Spirochaetia bacterium]
MLAVKGIYSGNRTVQLERDAPVNEGDEVIVTFVRSPQDREREPIIIPPVKNEKITDEMLGKPFIHTNGWKFDRDEANER